MSPEEATLKKRGQVIEEVVTSENTYFGRLQVDVYIDPLKELRILQRRTFQTFLHVGSFDGYP